MTHRAVVTGMGAITPLGVGADVLHRRAVAGESGIVNGVALCRDFEPQAMLSRHEMRRTDRFAQLALCAASEAIGQAGWTEHMPYRPERVACIVGTGLGGIDSLLNAHRTMAADAPDLVSGLAIPMAMPNSAAASIAIRFGLLGESFALSSACSAGAQAIGAARRLIAAGEVSAVVVGGAEAAHHETMIAGFRNMGALSVTGRSVPFHAARDGFILGEGAGMLVLENAEAAQARGAQVLAEFIGYGATSDAFHLTAPDPSAARAAVAITDALREAGLRPSDIDTIYAHGTATQFNDETEAKAILAALGPIGGAIPVTSTKSSIGHLLGAAGAVEAIALIQALRAGVAPPTVGLREIDEQIDVLDHATTARRLYARGGVRIGMSNAFGFGGHNAVLIARVDAMSGSA
ncbi:MAG: beta-ketoacyl-[acyl-carrier-protein] synthase family protein [Actinomycetota bacterium]|nr:beta-ketoacyl-[acyl-carrier-protein] synthase family protein [Actinomycetota bacterium]